MIKHLKPRTEEEIREFKLEDFKRDIYERCNHIRHLENSEATFKNYKQLYTNIDIKDSYTNTTYTT
jgi:hypothetical protein